MSDYNHIDFVVGTVREIKGTTIVIRMFENSNQLYYFFNGKRYSGVVIGSFIGIRRSEYIIVGKVEKEYAFDTLNDPSIHEFRKDRFVREVEVKILGNIYDNKYTMGISAFPQLFNDVLLLSDSQKELIIDFNGDTINEGGDDTFKIPSMIIGKIWPDGIEFNLKWYDLFNTHIAVFGNTGSGKSNTVAKLYHELFNYKINSNLLNLSKSKFLLLDFNGEYINDDCIVKEKSVIKLNTRTKKDHYCISKTSFWNKEMLSILFGATEQTQQPFLNRIVEYYFRQDEDFNEKLPLYISQAFGNVYSMPNRYGLDLFKKVIEILNVKNNEISYWIDKTIYNTSTDKFQSKETIEGWNNSKYWNNEDEGLLKNEKDSIKNNLSNKNLNIDNVIIQLQIAGYLRIIFELRYNTAQYDHIAPLLGRIDSRVSDFSKVIKIVDDDVSLFNSKLTVISLKEVNQDMKQLLPLIIAKSTYEFHKHNSTENTYFNLIVDEAHNILSESSKRESEKWKDYRLEVFEEIIKEGRKFSYFLTISSQRPADISATIVSQVHNYFIHRLVNDNDLRLLDNTLTSLDKVSKDSIPNLSPGQAILTGTLFELPMIVKIDKLPQGIAPSSENISLKDEWIVRQ